jgi:hypothetical protein
VVVHDENPDHIVTRTFVPFDGVLST